MSIVKKGPCCKKDDDKESTRQPAVDEIFLYTTCVKHPLTHTYEIGSSSTKTYKITLDFARSVNFTTVDEHKVAVDKFKVSAIISPFTRKLLGSMVQGSPRIASRLAVDCYYELMEVDSADVKAVADRHMSKVQELIDHHDGADDCGNLFIDKTFTTCRCYAYI
jgi:hypothetical protein